MKCACFLLETDSGDMKEKTDVLQGTLALMAPQVFALLFAPVGQ